MKKRRLMVSVIAILVALVFILTFIASVFPVGAASLSTQLENAKNQKRAAQQELSEIQNKKKTAESDKAKLDSEINDLNQQISAVSAELDRTAALLSQKETELALAQEECEKQFDSFKNRARIMYENGPSTYIEILFSSGSFSEFMSSIEIIKNLLDYDNRILEERKAAREEIAAQKTEIETIKNDQETRRQTLSQMQSTLETKRASQSAVISQLESREETVRRQVEEQVAEEARIQSLINQALAAQKISAQSASASVSGTGTMQWPCPSTNRLTSRFATRQHPIDGVTKMHNGIDIAGGYGADIIAADSGTVLFSGNSSSYGKYIVISHGGGLTTLYAHCSQLLVSAGATVSRGQTIAKVGSTGKSTGPHLHFEVSLNGSRQDPLSYVS